MNHRWLVKFENDRCTQPDYRSGIFLWGSFGTVWQGSQRSYLSERACTLLNLRRHGEHTLSIATFGSLAGTTRTCPIVTVNLNLNGHPPISLELYVMPTICEPLVGQPITACIETHQHLSKLELADSADDLPNLPVDLLLGSDYYWQLVTGKVLKWSTGPALSFKNQ